MNWKQFKKRVLEQNKYITFIDRQKANRGLNEVRFLRFFFCDKFEPLVNFYKAIGFYVMIEKSYFRKDYDLSIILIEKDTQKADNCIFRYTSFKAEDCYNEGLKKIDELMNLKVQLLFHQPQAYQQAFLVIHTGLRLVKVGMPPSGRKLDRTQ